jgi:hypothetical protein
MLMYLELFTIHYSLLIKVQMVRFSQNRESFNST